MTARGSSGEDLSAEALAAFMPGRPIRSFPALLSTGADALAWGRAGAPHGAIVVADYQASPRGRSGLEWIVRRGTSLCFSMILRPDLPPHREGWLYTVALSGLADVLGEDVTIDWPDQVRRGTAAVGAVGVHAELGPARVDWAVANVLVAEARPPRGRLLARVVEAIERRHASPPETVLSDYMGRCQTIGRLVRARLIPLGPSGPKVTGRATGSSLDGALVIETVRGTHVSVRPQNLGVLEDEEAKEMAAEPWPDFLRLSSDRRDQGRDPSTA